LKHKEAILQVEWAIQESYKIAVRLRGINDWTNDFTSSAKREQAKRAVDKYQLEIAKMILGELGK